jgi:diguanylate cyclase (GGDEF)-like protein
MDVLTNIKEMTKLPPGQAKEALSRLILFRGVSIEAIEHLLADCPLVELGAGDVLFRPGELNTDLYLIVDGCLHVHLDSLEKPWIAKLEAGESVGEMSLIDEGETSAFVVAAEVTHLLKVSREILWSMIDVSYGVARNLLAQLTGRVRHDNQLISKGLEQQKMLEQHARLDVLTGLKNRRWLEEVFGRLVQRASQGDGDLSVIMLDVDHFKQYNDRFGHLGGDSALRSVAHTLVEELRAVDLAARYGGEEFVVLLPDTDLAAAERVAERLRRAISAAKVIAHDDQSLPAVTVSLGVAELTAGQSPESFLQQADEALYRAKQGGRDCVSR